MPNTHYQRGRRFEYRCRDALREAGWEVWRTPASKSAADLIALRDGYKPLLVQCKTDAAAFALKDRRALAILARVCGAVGLLAARGEKRGEIDWYDVLYDAVSLDDWRVCARVDDCVEYVKGPAT